MANHKSTKKRIRSTKTRNEGNKYLHKTTRNAIKSLDGASSKDEKKQTPKVISMIDKLEKRNIIGVTTVPHDIAAPAINDISSLRGTNVLAGHFIYLAWAPCPVTPKTALTPSTQSCCHPVEQCEQVPQPS